MPGSFTRDSLIREFIEMIKETRKENVAARLTNPDLALIRLMMKVRERWPVSFSDPFLDPKNREAYQNEVRRLDKTLRAGMEVIDPN